MWVFGAWVAVVVLCQVLWMAQRSVSAVDVASHN